MIGEGAIVEHAVLLRSVAVEPGAVVRESIVGAGSRIGAESQVEGTVVGAETDDRLGQPPQRRAGRR